MARYICKDCGKNFDDDTAAALNELYGFVRCVDCEEKHLEAILPPGAMGDLREILGKGGGSGWRGKDLLQVT